MSICELSLEVLQMAIFSQITQSPTFGRASNQPVEKHRIRVRPWAPSLRWNEDIQTFLVHILHVHNCGICTFSGSNSGTWPFDCQIIEWVHRFDISKMFLSLTIITLTDFLFIFQPFH